MKNETLYFNDFLKEVSSLDVINHKHNYKQSVNLKKHWQGDNEELYELVEHIYREAMIRAMQKTLEQRCTLYVSELGKLSFRERTYNPDHRNRMGYGSKYINFLIPFFKVKRGYILQTKEDTGTKSPDHTS